MEKASKRNKFWLGASLIILAVILVSGWYHFFRGAEPEELDEPLVVAPLVSPPINPHQQRLVDEFEHYLDSLRLDRDIPAIAACIVYRGEPILLTALGHKINHTNDRVNAQTKFRLASVSKGFSAILVSMLNRDSVIRWQDRVNTHLPDFHPDPLVYSDSITIANIVSQTSGFPYQAYSNLIEDGWTLTEMIDALRQLKVASKPGEIYSYQNVAYSLIEPILEKETNKSFPELLNEKIFGPLSMTNASATYKDMSGAQNAASPHRRTRYSYVPVSLSRAYYNTTAAGGLNASISDMSKWLGMLTGHSPSVADTALLNEVFTPKVRTRLLNRYYRQWLGARRAYYGLGWRIVPTKSDTIIYHGGYANGFKSHVALDRQSDIAVCILSNSSDNLVNQAGPYFFHLFYKYEADIAAWNTSAAQ